VNGDSVFLIYALLFRFGIIAAGLYVISLGHALLQHRGGRLGADAATASTAEASLPGVRFKFQNVTAGTIFAMFGAVLIVAMVVQGNPEKTRHIQNVGGTATEITTLRGDDPIQAGIQAGREAEDKGATQEAVALYRAALLKAAPAMNSLAWFYARDGKARKGIAFSQAAVELDDSNAHFLDTLAEAESGVGDQAAALKAIERAAQLDPAFKPRLDEFRKRVDK